MTSTPIPPPNKPFDPYDPSTYPLPNLADAISGDFIRPLKTGGLADIYQGCWNSPDGSMKVALKVVRVGGGRDEKLLRRFGREIYVWNRLSHPNVLPIYGLCLGSWIFPAMVSQWCDRGDINDYLSSMADNPRIKEIQIALLLHAAHGLRYLHAKNIIHADIKGGNVLVSDNGVAKLSDFGLSVLVAEHSKSFANTTNASGTMRWMAPELLLEENSKYSTETDMWAFGCLCIEVFTGDIPFYKLLEQQVFRALDKRISPLQDQKVDYLASNTISECCQILPDARMTVDALVARLQLQLLSVSLSHFVARDSETSASAPLHIADENIANEIRSAISTLQFHIESHEDIYTKAVNNALQAACDDFSIDSDFRERIGQLLLNEPAAIANEHCPTPPTLTSLELEDIVSGLVLNDAPSLSIDPPILVQCIAYTPDGEHIACGCTDGGIRMWDVSAKVMASTTMTGHSDCVQSLAVSPDGSNIASGSHDSTVRVWSVKTSSEIICYREHSGEVLSVVFSPDGARIATGSIDNTIRVWDAASGNTLIRPIYGNVCAIAFSPDGVHILSGSYQRAVGVFNANTGIYSWISDTSTGVCSVAYSPNGQRIVAGCVDGSMIILNAETGAFVHSLLKGHTSSVNSVAFSRDGRKIASGSSDASVGLWDAEKGEELAVQGEGATVTSVAFSPDDTHVASASSNTETMIDVWDVTRVFRRW